MSQRKVLLLNRGESLVDIINWQDAVCLLIKGNAHAPYGYDDHYKIPVSLQSAERMKKDQTFDVEIEDDGEIRRGYFLLPSAIVLIEYVHIPYKTVALNKKNVLKRDKNICAYCGKHLTDATGSIDHVIPRSRWKEYKAKGLVKGKHANVWTNVVASCKSCNCKKDDRTPKEAGMTLSIKPFIPSKDYLILHNIDLRTSEIWSRWICFDDLK